jgi:1-aminocyclopropane-1-carboxylate deaminase/D-cysteine desulfhydrase-like pyridoxal-dependent ACC family enzyme
MDETLAPGYGQLNDATREAVRLGARLEGLILDPVYTGKALAGLIGLVRSGALSGVAPVVFLHTGGWPAVFAYREEIESL